MTDSANTLYQNTLEEFSFKTANDLYTPGKNLIYSPSSLSFALGMLLEGTDGQSRKEIVTSLFDPKHNGDEKAVAKASSFLVNLVRGHPEGIQKLVNVANFFYSHKDFKLHENYVKAIRDKYQANGRELDFIKANSEALAAINSDVNTATKGLIPQLLDAIESDTKAVLVNAIHFKGLWAKPFKTEDTVMDGEFHLSSGKTINVPMMKSTGNYAVGHCQKTNASILRLPYTSGTNDERIYMVVVLPEEGKIKQYLADFNADDFNQAVNQANFNDDTRISLPRFKIESTHKLIPTLKASGIGHIFTDGADLSKMSADANERLQVSEVIQKAVIECNEEGTEAAAATAIMMRFCCAIMDPPSFHADRPFIYALVTENKDRLKNILFVGVVENPLEK